MGTDGKNRVDVLSTSLRWVVYTNLIELKTKDIATGHHKNKRS